MSSELTARGFACVASSISNSTWSGCSTSCAIRYRSTSSVVPLFGHDCSSSWLSDVESSSSVEGASFSVTASSGLLLSSGAASSLPASLASSVAAGAELDSDFLDELLFGCRSGRRNERFALNSAQALRFSATFRRFRSAALLLGASARRAHYRS